MKEAVGARAHFAYLGLGSNIGDKMAYLHHATTAIGAKLGPVRAMSAVFLTDPWGLYDQPAFLNQVVLVETLLEPELLLLEVQAIERQMGRERITKWDRRIIDIDILFYDQVIYQSDTLQIPHPWIEQRNFVLAPLAEIAAAFIHPISKKSIRELLESSTDPLRAIPVEL
ncbi:MAG: 2-amino-4-hydroxy-6-hydroxymethyldihydropteridine diphosphokinase [Saprospiraceae bacterium]|jgi:2-amino-4-hydroxy-6-hydroxymethyldihydropteridine diphosphokinase